MHSVTPPRFTSTPGRSPAVVLAAATTLTSLVAHRAGGGALPNGAQWLVPLAAFCVAWLLARPMRMTSARVAVLLVVGQLIAHVALAVGIPHAMAQMPGHTVMAHGTEMPVMAGAASAHLMLAAHAVGTILAWALAHVLLQVGARARAVLARLLSRTTLPHIVIRRRRRLVRSERCTPVELVWCHRAPRRGPPSGLMAPA